MVNQRGIKANLNKILIVLDMSLLRKIHEVQRLVGRSATLSRLILKAKDKNMTFFKILRGATKFNWSAKCERTFVELKDYLSKTLLLFMPKPCPFTLLYLQQWKA